MGASQWYLENMTLRPSSASQTSALLQVILQGSGITHYGSAYLKKQILVLLTGKGLTISKHEEGKGVSGLQFNSVLFRV